MDHSYIIRQLAANRPAFAAVLSGIEREIQNWRPEPGHWNILEITCHLADEEAEDFRQRVLLTLEDPTLTWPAIHPENWVNDRGYAEQNYQEQAARFLKERDNSIEALGSLKSPNWSNTYHHPELGALSAGQLLANWLAHDYHHLRQMTRIRYAYLRHASDDVSLHYAGTW